MQGGCRGTGGASSLGVRGGMRGLGGAEWMGGTVGIWGCREEAGGTRVVEGYRGAEREGAGCLWGAGRDT